MTGSVQELAVGLNGRRVGTLRRVRNGARFAYSPDVAAALLGAPLLSTALPVREREYDAATTSTWFRGLLPEDARLEQVRRFYGVEEGDYLDVLACIGWECAGAVEVMSEGDWALRRAGAGAPAPDCYESLSADRLAARLAALPAHPFDTPDSLRMSLGGFQEKLCVFHAPLGAAATVGADGFSLPLGGAPSTHILKPASPRFAGLVQAEAWAMRVAAQVTATARVAVLGLPGGAEALCVERFDRVPGTCVSRVHQEDCAQALLVDPERKYTSQGSPKKSDPSFRRIASLLRSYALEDADEQLGRLFDQMVVNVVLGNTDAHAKNYSLMHPVPGGVALSPLYDVVPALEITPNVRHMGMRVANQIALERVGREELLAEGEGWGLARAGLERRLDHDLAVLALGMEQARDCYPAAARRHEGAALRRAGRLARC